MKILHISHADSHIVIPPWNPYIDCMTTDEFDLEIARQRQRGAASYSEEALSLLDSDDLLLRKALQEYAVQAYECARSYMRIE